MPRNDRFSPEESGLSAKCRRTGHALRRFALPGAALFLCAVLLWAAQGLSARFDYHSVIRTLHQFRTTLLVQAFLATALSYAALVARDAVGLRYLGARVPRSTLW